MTEKYLRSNKILKYLKTLPFSDWEVSPPNSPTAKADITGCWYGLYVAIEVKLPGKGLERHQAYRQKELIKAGAWTMTVHSVEEVKDEIEFWGKKGRTR